MEGTTVAADTLPQSQPRPERPDSYDRLAAFFVRNTLSRLHRRMTARFPDRNLPRVARVLAEVVDVAESGVGRTDRRARALRLLCYVVAGVVAASSVLAVVLAIRSATGVGRNGITALEWLPILESGINDVVFAGVAVGFLLLAPGRAERAAMLEQLHRLRSIAHVIDMHQLTKAPETVRAGFVPTSASPIRHLDAQQLAHYLDYCSELLSIVSKTAALFAEHSRDPVVLDTISDIEILTTGMSRKIWQKISLLPVDPSERAKPGPRD